MPLNPQALASKDASLSAILQRTTQTLQARISRAVDDAEAHAATALTRAVRSAPSGRPTLAEVRKTKGVGAAVARLGELRPDLITILEKSRADLYQAAIRGWVQTLDSRWLIGTAGTVSQAQLDHARSLVVGGLPLTTEIQIPIDAAVRELDRTLAIAGTPAPDDTTPDELLGQWAETTRGAIERTTLAALEDGASAMDRLAGRDCLDPKLLHPDPTLT